MPMPTTVNGLPVRTGSWEPAEDRALAEWQGQLGNRWELYGCHGACAKAALQAGSGCLWTELPHRVCHCVQMGGSGEAHPRSYGPAVCAAVASQGERLTCCPMPQTFAKNPECIGTDKQSVVTRIGVLGARHC